MTWLGGRHASEPRRRPAAPTGVTSGRQGALASSQEGVSAKANDTPPRVRRASPLTNGLIRPWLGSAPLHQKDGAVFRLVAEAVSRGSPEDAPDEQGVRPW